MKVDKVGWWQHPELGRIKVDSVFMDGAGSNEAAYGTVCFLDHTEDVFVVPASFLDDRWEHLPQCTGWDWEPPTPEPDAERERFERCHHVYHFKDDRAAWEIWKLACTFEGGPVAAKVEVAAPASEPKPHPVPPDPGPDHRILHKDFDDPYKSEPLIEGDEYHLSDDNWYRSVNWTLRCGQQAAHRFYRRRLTPAEKLQRMLDNGEWTELGAGGPIWKSLLSPCSTVRIDPQYIAHSRADAIAKTERGEL